LLEQIEEEFEDQLSDYVELEWFNWFWFLNLQIW
jgi:hypothetical protein